MKRSTAPTPPMGWNSWDCYGTSVTEQEVLDNAAYMRDNLKEYGWQYVVVDIQWYEPNAFHTSYNPFADLAMDDYSRLIPAENRFPSSAGGRGFIELGQKIHQMGLKFGIHIMRGIPRQAVHRNTPIKGTKYRARDIASTASIASWNTDMYGVNASKPGAQEYYNSLLELYAEWGVDFIKVDDIARSFIGDNLYHKKEVELIRKAIDRCGREIVLSLSPGPALLEESAHLTAHADMWRISNDYWDRWEDLYDQFARCARWSPHSGPGHWPDADMLPLGHLAVRSNEHNFGERQTRFTREEQRTMMALWAIFRSPLMLGCVLTDLDEGTLALLCNEELIRLNQNSQEGREIRREGDLVLWGAHEDDREYRALFNLGDEDRAVENTLDTWELRTVPWGGINIFTREKEKLADGNGSVKIPAHGVKLFWCKPR